MRRSGGGKQKVVLSEDARARQQIRDMAMVLQQTGPVAANQVLASKSTASSSLAVELLSHRLLRQLKNRCMLSGSRIDTLCTNMSHFLRIPLQMRQSFRSKPATCSSPNQPLVPVSLLAWIMNLQSPDSFHCSLSKGDGREDNSSM